MSAETLATGPSLAELQRIFYRLMVAPQGAAEGLAALGLDERALDGWVGGDERLSALERLDIYANMYFFRIRDVLREEYPLLLKAVGDDAFHDLTVDYLMACPPAHWSIGQAGARLPTFLPQSSLGAEQPWLAELAALERTELDLFTAADAATLTVEALRDLEPERFAMLELRLVPAHRVLHAAHDVVELGSWLDEGGAPMTPATKSVDILVWRQDIATYRRVLEPEEVALWPLLEEGTMFGILCEHLGDGREPEAAAQLAFQLLGRWAAEHLLVATI